MLDLVHEQLEDDDSRAGTRGGLLRRRRLDDDELRDAAAEDEQRRAQARARHAEATRSNLGLGHDIRAGLIQPTDAQLRAVRDIVCRLLVRHYGELIAYGAGWTDPERQQPVGDTGRHEPAPPRRDRRRRAAASARGPRPAARDRAAHRPLGAAFVLEPGGVTRTKALGSERMARKLRDALPGGETTCAPPSGSSCGRCSRPRSSRSTATRSSSTSDTRRPSTSPAATARHRDLDELDLDELNTEAA